MVNDQMEIIIFKYGITRFHEVIGRKLFDGNCFLFDTIFW